MLLVSDKMYPLQGMTVVLRIITAYFDQINAIVMIDF